MARAGKRDLDDVTLEIARRMLSAPPKPHEEMKIGKRKQAKPKVSRSPHELWTTRLLARHAREHGRWHAGLSDRRYRMGSSRAKTDSLCSVRHHLSHLDECVRKCRRVAVVGKGRWVDRVDGTTRTAVAGPIAHRSHDDARHRILRKPGRNFYRL